MHDNIIIYYKLYMYIFVHICLYRVYIYASTLKLDYGGMVNIEILINEKSIMENVRSR